MDMTWSFGLCQHIFRLVVADPTVDLQLGVILDPSFYWQCCVRGSYATHPPLRPSPPSHMFLHLGQSIPEIRQCPFSRYAN